MPRVTQYIREEDLEAWNAIKNKSKWIHEHLNPRQPAGPRPLTGKDIKDLGDELSEKTKPKKSVEPTTYKPTKNWGA